MSNIREFLLARIAEDEAAARALHSALRNKGPVPAYHDQVASAQRRQWPTFWRAFDACPNPDRVLAECASKRQIVGLHAPQYAVAYRESERLLAEAFDQDKVRALASSGPIWPYPASQQTLLALAQPYADHPDFDPAWSVK